MRTCASKGSSVRSDERRARAAGGQDGRSGGTRQQGEGSRAAPPDHGCLRRCRTDHQARPPRSDCVSDVFLVALFAIPAILGIRATYRLWRIYLHDPESRHQKLLLGWALIATIITAAALWFGAVAATRLL